jgi:hypothetical protein
MVSQLVALFTLVAVAALGMKWAGHLAMAYSMSLVMSMVMYFVMMFGSMEWGARWLFFLTGTYTLWMSIRNLLATQGVMYKRFIIHRDRVNNSTQFTLRFESDQAWFRNLVDRLPRQKFLSIQMDEDSSDQAKTQ